MTVTGVHHVRIDVDDIDRSQRFYRDVLGFEQIVRYDRDDGATIVQMGINGAPPGLELWHQPPHTSFAHERLHIALAVEDLQGLLDELAKKGIHPQSGPFRKGHEYIAFIIDPDNYLIELYEWLRSPHRD